MKAGLYVRISTGEQSKFSLEAQKDQLKEYCKCYNVIIHNIYTDIKGRFTFDEREGLMNLLDDVEKGRIQVVLVTELDRLSGDEGITGYIKYTLKKHGVKLIAINEQGKVGDEYQELMDGILTAVAKFENKRKRLRCRRGIKKAREQGKVLNRCPFGYVVQGKGTRDSRVVPDPDKSLIVKDVFDRYLCGQSMYRIAKELCVSKSNIRYILSNRFYCDPLLYGKHTPLIPFEVFERANQGTDL